MSTQLLFALSIVFLGLSDPTMASVTQADEESVRCDSVAYRVQGDFIPAECQYEPRETNHLIGERQHADAALQYAATSRDDEHSSWSMSVSRDPDRVGVDGPADDGIASFSGGCNRLLGPGLWATLYNYRGKMLRRIDDESEDVFFTILRNHAPEQVFAGQMHYVASDQAWVTTTPLPINFIIALSRGDSLVFSNADDARVVSFNLKGIGLIVDTMRDVCGF